MIIIASGNSLPTYCSSSSTGRDCWNGQEQVENGTVSSNHILKAYISDQKDANGYYAFDLDSLHQQVYINIYKYIIDIDIIDIDTDIR